jgi:iron complex transport system substrate-binding protein
MKAKLAVLSLLVLFGWGMLRSGQVGQSVDRWKKAPAKPAPRQIKLLGETAKYRLVSHSLGQAKVPRSPQRIVTLSPAATDSLAALEVRPALITSSWQGDGPAPYLADRLRGVPVLRRAGTLPLEAVSDAKPDLIFAETMQDGRLYSHLSAMAPTVYLSSMGSGDRETSLLDVGDVLGLAGQARRRLAEYRRYREQARQTLAAKAKGQPVTFLRFRRNTCVIYARSTMFGPLLFEQLGLLPDPAMPIVMSSGGWDVLSVERLSTLTAEHIFMVVDPDSEAYLRRVAETPIWRDIPAVRHDHVHRVASKTWLSGEGVLGCEAIIADVLAAMAPQGTH